MFVQSRPEFREDFYKVGGFRCCSQSAKFADLFFKATRWHKPKVAASQGEESILRFW
jgi:hypothetical protein